MEANGILVGSKGNSPGPDSACGSIRPGHCVGEIKFGENLPH